MWELGFFDESQPGCEQLGRQMMKVSKMCRKECSRAEMSEFIDCISQCWSKLS